jgi:hypothetical protein
VAEDRVTVPPAGTATVGESVRSPFLVVDGVGGTGCRGFSKSPRRR